MRCNIFLRHSIELGWVDNTLCGQGSIGLKEGIRLEEGNHIGVWHATIRVSSIRSSVGEIAGQHFRGEGADLIGYARSLPLALVADKPEHLVFHDWAAQSAAKLIAAESIFGQAVLIVEIAIGGEGVVAIELEHGAVNLIGSGLCDQADDAAGIAAILCRVIAGEDAEFLHRVRVGRVDNPVAEQVVVYAAVKEKRNRV